MKKSFFVFFGILATLSVGAHAQSVSSKKPAVKQKIAVGIIQACDIGDYQHLTILRKDNNKKQDFLGCENAINKNDEIKKEFQNSEVRVIYHTERIYIPEDNSYSTSDIVDQIELMK
jgi:hypothetical protein